MGRLPEAWVVPHQVRELRELTHCRHKLVRLRTSCKDQVHAILARLGIPVTCIELPAWVVVTRVCQRGHMLLIG
jgi:hypothetical protein